MTIPSDRSDTQTGGPIRPPTMHERHPWLTVIRRYLCFMAFANLAWEFLHLPLYTVWKSGSAPELIFAAAHCTGGDILIASSALTLALVLAGDGRWPERGYAKVAALAGVLGLSYTIFSEWLNVGIRGTWAYSELMPVVPFVGTGLSPLLQWMVIPSAGFWWARRSVRRIAAAQGR